jgi:serine/threonine-protein kinase
MSMLAKDPKNRPADAIKLAEAAEAIRAGNIAAAHAAVPGMLLFESATGPITAPTDIATAPTGIVTSPFSKETRSTSTAALPVIGAAAAGGAAGAAAEGGNALTRANALAAERSLEQADEHDQYFHEEEEYQAEPQRKKRSPWTWPLVALIVLLLFALVGVILSQSGLFSPSNPAPAKTSAPAQTSSASPSSASPSATATPTPSATTAEAINLIPEAYKGQPYDKVRSELGALGLRVNGIEVFNPAAPGTVIDINPSGAVAKGTTIDVTYSKGPGTVQVPTIGKGATESQVQAAIEGAGLRWVAGNTVDGTIGQAPGTFVSSDPAAGTKVAAGSVVTYHLSKPLVVTPPTTPK